MRSAFLLLYALAFAPYSWSMATAAPTVNTVDCGPVMGMGAGAAVVFRGIPYASAPTGARRWRAPIPLQEAGGCWNGTLDTSEFGASCPQSPGSMPVGDTSEDCLFLVGQRIEPYVAT